MSDRVNIDLISFSFQFEAAILRPQTLKKPNVNQKCTR